MNTSNNLDQERERLAAFAWYIANEISDPATKTDHAKLLDMMVNRILHVSSVIRNQKSPPSHHD